MQPQDDQVARSSCLSAWNGFRHFSSDDEKEYQKFVEKESSVTIHVIAFIGAAIHALLAVIQAAALPLPHALFMYQRVLVLPPLGLYAYRSMSKHVTHLKPLPIRDSYIGDAVILSSAITYGVYLLGLTYVDGCDYANSGLLFCENSLSAGSALIYVVMCTGIPIIYKCRHISLALFSIAIEIFVIAMIDVKLRLSPKYNVISVLVGLILCQVAILFDFEAYSRQIYMVYTNLDITIRSKLETDNDKTLMELQSTELRYLIGNVAHDLKTPLHAFMNELDTVRGILVNKSCSGNDRCFSSSVEAVTVGGGVEKDMEESVDILSGICSFMVMTINRAIDYTKASSGITLTPSLETVSLSASLQWAATCVSRASSNGDATTVVIEPLPPECCDSVVTDKQWLLENLLCLVSNAQKYSSRGVVGVHCTLQSLSDPKVPPRWRSRKIYPSSTSSTSDVSCNSDANNSTSIPDRTQSDSFLQSDVLPYSSNSRFFSNACDTARKYLTGSTRQEAERMLVLSVEDEGIGIPVEMRESLFQPFKQTMRRAGGTGLGLYSLSKRVERLGGSCGVADRSDGRPIGCRIWFSIPYRPDYTDHGHTSCVETTACDMGIVHNSVSRKCSGSDWPDAVEGEKKGLSLITSILLVDDSNFIQKTTARVLRKLGVAVDIARNGVECLQKLEKGCFGLVLMDIQMPLMDGLEATRRLREIEWRRNLQLDHQFVIEDIETGTVLPPRRSLVIGLSANSDGETRQEALNVGMDFFLPKPLRVSELQSCLQQLGYDIPVSNMYRDSMDA